MPRGIPNSGTRKVRKSTRVIGQPRDNFKISDIKEDAVVNAVVQRAGAKSDPEVSGFVKSVIPRYADWSAQQGIKSMSNMAKEFSKAGQMGGPRGSSESRATANGDTTTSTKRRPGRPRKQSAKAASSEKGQAAGSKRRPGRPRKERPSA